MAFDVASNAERVGCVEFSKIRARNQAWLSLSSRPFSPPLCFPLPYPSCPVPSPSPSFPLPPSSLRQRWLRTPTGIAHLFCLGDVLLPLGLSELSPHHLSEQHRFDHTKKRQHQQKQNANGNGKEKKSGNQELASRLKFGRSGGGRILRRTAVDSESRGPRATSQ